MVKRKRAALVPDNIALLQNLIRRDPLSYREEFLIQQRHYETLRDLFKESPSETRDQEAFSELIGFISQMCTCYPKETEQFPEELANLLKDHHNELSQELREKMVQSLTMLRNKEVITSGQLIHTLFPLLISTESKQMRTQIYSSLITLMKSENKGAKNQKLNKNLQALLFTLLTDHQASGLWATKITRELWKRGIWDDSRTVEIMCLAAMDRQDLKVASSAARFFLSADQEREEAQNEQDDDEGLDLGTIKHQSKVNKKTKKREKKAEQLMERIKKRTHANQQVQLNFSAIHLLNDPQGFADNLFSTHLTNTNNATNENGTVIHRPKLNLEQKLLFLKLVSRLVGNHKLQVLGLYSFFLKYLTLKQQDVTQFLAAAAEACHDLVPPDVVQPMVRKIADEFVSDGVSSEACAAGINTITEIVKRAPLAITEELLQDLVAYKDSKAKGVNIASRRLISLFREIDPSMLPAKERGKAATMHMKDIGKENVGVKFGTESGVTGFEGLDLLQKWKEENANEDGEEDENDGWEIASQDSDDDSDSESGWINVESDKEYSVSDSDDDSDDDGDKEDVKKPKLTEQDFIEMASKDILTPADFAKMDELKNQAGIDKLMGRRTGHNEENVDADTLQGPKKYKQTREERIAHAQEGREDREFGSNRGKKLADKAHSTTNKQKARKKNFMMMVHKKDVQGKAKRSLRDKRKALLAHKEHQRKRKEEHFGIPENEAKSGAATTRSA